MKTHHDIVKYFSDDHPVILDEQTYKDFMNVISPNDLPHKDYAPLLKSVKYVETEGNTMKFFVINNINGWNTYVQFVDWDNVLADASTNAVDASRLLLWSGNIRLHCPCPSFKFYGYQYILTQLSAAIYPEVRFPHIRNPHLKGVCCKHLRRTLKVLPFHTGVMASQIKSQRYKLQSQ